MKYIGLVVFSLFISCKKEVKSSNEVNKDSLVVEESNLNKESNLSSNAKDDADLLNWNCIDKGGDMNTGFVTNCTTNATIEVSYNELKNDYFEDGKLLLSNLPQKDTVYVKDNVEIQCKIGSGKNVGIELSYPGGSTEFSLLESDGKTTVIKTMYPD